MSNAPSSIEEFDFDQEMQRLAAQADTRPQQNDEKAEQKKPVDLQQLLVQMIRPVAQGMALLNHSVSEQKDLLSKLNASSKVQHMQTELLEEIGDQLERKSTLEAGNQKLFDAMHQELKQYKDGFLFEALQKPFIFDLITVYDDLTAVLRQLKTSTGDYKAGAGIAGEDPAGNLLFEATQNAMQNVENLRFFVIEMFHRLDVVPMEKTGERLDKKSHRAVAFEPADEAAEHGLIVKRVKRGFLWRERVLRPEEVIIKRWLESEHVAPETPESPENT